MFITYYSDNKRFGKKVTNFPTAKKAMDRNSKIHNELIFTGKKIGII